MLENKEKYNKPPLSIKEQIELLKSRGWFNTSRLAAILQKNPGINTPLLAAGNLYF